jgi:Family of unknown function (DUF5681)
MTRNTAAAKAIEDGDLTASASPTPRPWLAPAWQPGKSGNPAGRPKGARSKLAELTLTRLLADFDQHGVEAIEEVRRKNPSHYLAAIVSLLPKQQEKIDSPFADLTDDELAQLELWLAASRAKNVTIDVNATSDTQESSRNGKTDTWTEPEPQS